MWCDCLLHYLARLKAEEQKHALKSKHERKHIFRSLQKASTA